MASARIVELLLNGEESLQVRYAGDRMWPSIAHGEGVRLTPLAGAPARGSVVLCLVDGVPDLLRVVRAEGDRTEIAGDADPSSTIRLDRREILAVADLPRRPSGHGWRAWRRLRIDLAETRRTADSPARDLASTVMAKYDEQARFYARTNGPEMEQRLLARIEDRVPAGGRILVVGSGTGRECFALARCGWQVGGIDFSRSMVDLAREGAAERGLAVSFEVSDVRTHEESPRSLDAILFTYDVYSFIPGREERCTVLRTARRWLRPDGCVFLSARRFHRVYDRLLLALCRAGGGRGPWGRCHTRWLGSEGDLHRSFIQLFSESGLRREARDSGYDMEPWEGGHAVLTPIVEGAVDRDSLRAMSSARSAGLRAPANVES
jgi:2-polyprenyl-3-methyl-5-hydroxy-6-metoxy-1,4-benzoquinol methylase